MKIIMWIFILAFIGTFFMSCSKRKDGLSFEEGQKADAARMCLEICPKGVKKFEMHYSDRTCECLQ